MVGSFDSYLALIDEAWLRVLLSLALSLILVISPLVLLHLFELRRQHLGLSWWQLEAIRADQEAAIYSLIAPSFYQSKRAWLLSRLEKLQHEVKKVPGSSPKWIEVQTGKILNEIEILDREGINRWFHFAVLPTTSLTKSLALFLELPSIARNKLRIIREIPNGLITTFEDGTLNQVSFEDGSSLVLDFSEHQAVESLIEERRFWFLLTEFWKYPALLPLKFQFPGPPALFWRHF
jgi:hypothetical protein